MDKAQGHCDGRIATYPRPRSFARHGGSLKDGSWMDCVEEKVHLWRGRGRGEVARLQCLLAVEVVGNKNPVGIAENNKRFRPRELNNVASARNSKTLRSAR